MFGTEKVICPKNSEGWLVGFGTALVWIDPNYFGSLCSNPNKIQTNDMVGGVMYFCLHGKHNGSLRLLFSQISLPKPIMLVKQQGCG